MILADRIFAVLCCASPLYYLIFYRAQRRVIVFGDARPLDAVFREHTHNFSKGLPTLRQTNKLRRHCHACLTTQPFLLPCAPLAADLSRQVGPRMYCLQEGTPRELLSRSPSFPPQTTSGCLTPFHTAVICSSEQLNMAVVARTILLHPTQCSSAVVVNQQCTET